MDHVFHLLVVLCFCQFSMSFCQKEEKDAKSEVQLFRGLFIKRRIEHKEAVKSISSYDDYSKQYKIIEAVFQKSFGVLQTSQVTLRENGYIPGMDFPLEENIKEALALLLETTSFMSEMVLHFPDICHRILQKHQDKQLYLTWGILFASQSSFLDENTAKLIYLVSQELGLAEPDPNYVNPYGSSQAPEAPIEDKTVHKKPRKSFKKGPRMSNNEL